MNFAFSDIKEILEKNAEAHILPYYRQLSKDQVREKSPGNLVTDADEASEAFLTEALPTLVEHSLVVGEEAVAKDEKTLDFLNADKPVWIIDPIDGTYNFTRGRSKWGVLISLFHNNRLIFGCMHDVLNQQFMYAFRGEGAYHYKDNQEKKLSLIQPDKPVSQFCGHVGGAQAWHFKKLNQFCGDISNIRCSMHDFWAFLAGDIDFTFHSNTTAWDHSAASMIIEEAGGYMAAGHDHQPYDPRLRQKHLLSTYNRQTWQDLADKFHTVL